SRRPRAAAVAAAAAVARAAAASVAAAAVRAIGSAAADDGAVPGQGHRCDLSSRLGVALEVRQEPRRAVVREARLFPGGSVAAAKTNAYVAAVAPLDVAVDCAYYTE